ncbi:hypothetical protein FH972_022508 [Carpinus fangiana]|uniref:Tuberous sclerosis 1 n=1 Tax=Carpinus fangiana TaxID=176857 RepID=A0A5N6KT02_9ROSI|nr:hypothetical protein FH972_022508 [Carpinus fangiana]
MASGYGTSSEVTMLRTILICDPRSFKDTTKALNSFFSTNNTVRTVPDDLHSTIQAYLDKHEPIDDSDSQKIHDELKNIYNKHILEQRDARLGAFLHALCLLQPAITGYARKAEWWKLLIGPILDGIGHRRDEISYATQTLLAFMDYDSDTERGSEQAKESGGLLKLLVAAYMKRARTKDVESEVLTEEDEYIANQLEEVLVAFGRRKPKEIMMALDGLIVDVKTRFQAMSILCAFVRHQPPHLYTVSETPLIEHLLKCLLIDTSSTIIQIALTTLIMFLPHIPSSIVAHLPRLFLIYTRLLCWERVRRTPREEGDVTSIGSSRQDSTDNEADPSWVKLETLMTTLGPIAPNLNFYFTFLYGMYPLNFLSYIRKPRKYLKSIDFPRAEEFDFDQALIRKRTDEFRKVHLIHPNLFMITAEEELEDDRWIKSDPADVVGECMGLCMGIDTEAVQSTRDQAQTHRTNMSDVPSDFVRTEDIPTQSLNDRDDLPLLAERPLSPPDARLAQSVASGSNSGPSLSRKTSQRSTRTPVSLSSAFNSPALRSVDEGPGSPILPAVGGLPAKSAAKGRNGSVVSFHSVSEHSQRLEEHSARPSVAAKSPGMRPVSHMDANKAFLQREVMLLRNDLNFERYLKQQHLSHIGQLQRRQIKEATLEADTQNLIQTNKTLNAKLTKANESYAALKKETATGRQNSKKFETELASKLRSLREAERAWELREGELASDLNSANSDCGHLRRLIVESEARELLGQQKVASMEIQLEQVDELRAKIAQLEQKVKSFQAKELAFEKAQDDLEVLRTELATATFQLQTKDGMTERTISALKQHIEELEDQVQEAREPSKGQKLTAQMQLVMENTIAAANARYDRLRNDYAALKHRFVELELRNQELEEAGLSENTYQAIWASAGPEEHPRNVRSASSPTSTRFRTSGDGSIGLPVAAAAQRHTSRTANKHNDGGAVSKWPSHPSSVAAESEPSESVADKPAGVYGSSQSRFSDDSLVASSDGAASRTGKAKASPTKTTRMFGRGR